MWQTRPLASRSLHSRGETDNETVIIDTAKTAMGEITSEELPSQTRGPEQVSQRELGCVR